MVYVFPGVKRDSSGAYFYDDRDIAWKTVPLGDPTGNITLSKAQLKEHFGYDEASLGKLPKYFIVPRLDSRWDDVDSARKRESWWKITGAIVVYEAIEWVPVLRQTRILPKNYFETEFEQKDTIVRTTELYGSTELTVNLSAGGGYGALKADVSSKTEVKASYKFTQTQQEEITRRGKSGEVVVKEVSAGLALKAKRVAERKVDLHLNGDKKGGSLWWRYPERWDEVHVPDADLRNVAGLQFANIRMTGSGHSTSLLVQALPVFNSNQELVDLHLALSCSEWRDYYAYTEGKMEIIKDRTETIAVPAESSAAMTFIAVKD